MGGFGDVFGLIEVFLVVLFFVDLVIIGVVVGGVCGFGVEGETGEHLNGLGLF